MKFLNLFFLVSLSSSNFIVEATRGNKGKIPFSAKEHLLSSSLSNKDKNSNSEEENGRGLEEERQNDWMKSYSVQFTGCYKVPSFSGEDDEESTTSTLLATYSLCPTDDGCGTTRRSKGCPQTGGHYVVGMKDYIYYTSQAAMSAMEYNCNAVTEKCEYQCENGYYNYNNNNGNANANDDGYNNYNNNNDDDYCLNQCLVENEMESCTEGNDGNGDDNNNDEDYLDYIDCRPMFNGEDNQNQNNYYGQNVRSYFVGAHCINGGVYVDTFTDSQCTVLAEEGTYERFMGGQSVPYSSQNLIQDDCISCRESNGGENNNNQDNNNNYYGNDYYDDDDVLETCEMIYEESGKCEEHVSSQNQYLKLDNSSCKIIDQIKWEQSYDTVNRFKIRNTAFNKGAAGALAFFAISTISLCFVIIILCKRIEVANSYQEGGYRRESI